MKFHEKIKSCFKKKETTTTREKKNSEIVKHLRKKIRKQGKLDSRGIKLLESVERKGNIVIS